MESFIFAVNAISGGGKTATTKELQKLLSNSKALYFDDRNYDSDSGIDDICKWIEDGADVNLFDLNRLADDIEALKQENLDFIIMDYPFGYRHKLIAPYLNYSIFIDTPFDIALARRILRDYDKETMISAWDDVSTIFDDMKHYLERGRNAYLCGPEEVKQAADFLVDGSLPLDKIVECIAEQAIKMRAKL